MLGKRVLVPPHQSPDKPTHSLWIDTVHLCNSDCYLLCPFNFEPRSDIVRLSQFVTREIWDSLLLLRISLCIFPPILSLSGRKLSTSNINSPVVLLEEVGFSVKKYVLLGMVYLKESSLQYYPSELSRNFIASYMRTE